MINITSIKPYKNFTLYDFISPVKYDKLYLMSYMIEIINKYKLLYNPNNANDWEEIYDDIKLLEVHTEKELVSYLNKSNNELELIFSSENKLKSKTSTKEKKKQKEKSKCKIKKDMYIKDLKELILDYIKTSDYILVSETAYNLLNNIKKSYDFTDENEFTNGVLEII